MLLPNESWSLADLTKEIAVSIRNPAWLASLADALMLITREVLEKVNPIQRDFLWK